MYPAAFVLKTQQRDAYDTRSNTLYTGTDLLEAPGTETDRNDYGPRANGVGGLVAAVFALLGYAAVLPF